MNDTKTFMPVVSVCCIATSPNHASQIVDELEHANFSSDDISVLCADEGACDECLGWLADIGALALPGAEPLIAAGPIMAALRSAADGGIAEGLIGLGVADVETRRYQSKIKLGYILISVHPESSDGIDRAVRIFTKAWAQDICISGETSSRKG